MWKAAKNVFFYSAPALQGSNKQTLNMADYQGKVLIISNVASEWGLTRSNYDQFTKLHNKYHSQGLEIICQPCNQFGKQERFFGQQLYDNIAQKFITDVKVQQEMLANNFFERNDVNGKNASELFLYLQNHPNTSGFGSNSLKWNFTKFLVGRDGVPVRRLSPQEEPFKMIKDIEAELAKPNPLEKNDL